MAFLVACPVDGLVACAGRAPLDPCGCTTVFDDELSACIGIATSIGDDATHDLQPGDQTPGLRTITPASGRVLEPDGQAKCIDGNVDLARPTSP